VATAVSNEPGDAVFGLSVSGLAERMPEERLHELGSIISDAATRLHLAASAGR
jgi:DNA-binding IclR family transcriptional regulator